MQVGTFLPTYWTTYGASTVAEAVRETALAAAELNYASLWANDHVLAPAHRAEMGYIAEPLTTLASVIHLAPTLTLGTSTLVLPQRDAIVVAKQVATLDVLSGGRFILGIGVGWQEEEFAMLGADFAQRGAVADEAVAVMRALWSEERTTFHGSYYDFADAVFHPKPTAGRVPLWVCGNTPAAIRRAARLGDAWNPFCMPLAEFTAGVAALRADHHGRPMPLIAAHMQIRIGEAAGPPAHLSGSAPEVLAALRGYREAGMDYLICDFVAPDLPDLLRQMRVMAQQVTPALVG